ncbi:uncharacterized protein GGS22DRAFT_171472 [Annulohypoxylon maeteangense]|uniref:uncharacterized protein n=1 Tax=Annulohypoxylon maeteangense TaxID=1927788 RepID=UPI002007943B|nr:uncharacterized protein GGS22DRAFT_171472 [Annulohypoxylon maeteangense]KAI0882073.1 hypothetical protein GGS22DRAFT_171472 [Annulohypoxylon maeteangense]
MDPADEELILEDSLDGSEEEDSWMDWDMWWQIIVNRNEEVDDPDLPEYPTSAWSLDMVDPPFPFNLDATLYCAAVLAIILAIHSEIDTAWLLRHGYRYYLMRISSKTLLTVAISFASTLLFEVIGNVADLVRRSYMEGIIIKVNSLLVKWLHWGPVDEHGNAGLDGEIIFDHDPTQIRPLIRNAVTNIVLLAFDCLFLILSHLIPMAIGVYFIWLVSYVSRDLAIFLYNLSTYVALPTPNMDGAFDIKDMLWEFGPPVYFQLWAAALIYLSVFVFISRSETPLILYKTGLDPFSKLMLNLLRATTTHVLSYTAYQLVCLCVTIMPPAWFSRDGYLSIIIRDPVVQKIVTRFNLGFYPVTALLLIGAHWIVRNVCRLLVTRLYPLSVPYIVWLSIKTERATRQQWVVYGPFLNGDMAVLELGNRVMERVVMTIMFGLKSSWPVRMRLSAVPVLD